MTVELTMLQARIAAMHLIAELQGHPCDPDDIEATALHMLAFAADFAEQFVAMALADR